MVWNDNLVVMQPLREGQLHVVATPIGNLKDISPRAVEVLGAADLVVAEDTRHSRVLLSHHGLNPPLQAMHEHNEAAVIPALLERLKAGEHIAVVSDAGTPLISDPGYRLVRAAHEAGIPVRAVPGPSAVTAALSVCGLPTDRFIFEGFLPAREASRRNALEHVMQHLESRVVEMGPVLVGSPQFECDGFSLGARHWPDAIQDRQHPEHPRFRPCSE